MGDCTTFTLPARFGDVLFLIPGEKDRKELAFALAEYGFKGKEPDLGYPLDAMFALMRDDIDASIRE